MTSFSARDNIKSRSVNLRLHSVDAMALVTQVSNNEDVTSRATYNVCLIPSRRGELPLSISFAKCQ